MPLPVELNHYLANEWDKNKCPRIYIKGGVVFCRQIYYKLLLILFCCQFLQIGSVNFQSCSQLKGLIMLTYMVIVMQVVVPKKLNGLPIFWQFQLLAQASQY